MDEDALVTLTVLQETSHVAAGDDTESSAVAAAGLVSFSRSGLRSPLSFTDCLFGELCRLALFGEL